jgi:hypothetical protein
VGGCEVEMLEGGVHDGAAPEPGDAAAPGDVPASLVGSFARISFSISVGIMSMDTGGRRAIDSMVISINSPRSIYSSARLFIYELVDALPKRNRNQKNWSGLSRTRLCNKRRSMSRGSRARSAPRMHACAAKIFTRS